MRKKNDKTVATPKWLGLVHKSNKKKSIKAFVAGLALTFTLCGINAFGQIAPPWPVPGAGDGTIPLWNGAADSYTYNDAIYSTGADQLHAIGITGKGVSSAVIDSLYDVYHPEWTDNIVYGAQYVDQEWVDQGYTPPNGGSAGLNVGTEFVNSDDYILAGRNITHGSHVAGIIHSMAPDAGLVLLNAWFEELSDNATGIDTNWLISHAADIAGDYSIVSLNGSYGGNDHYDEWNSADAQNPETFEALEKLNEAGVLGLFASGNEGINNAIGAPAAVTGAVAIGALSDEGLITSFSNQNELVVLLAPGQFINSTVPYAIGGEIVDDYGRLSGTSMATPHVTGAVALLASGARMASSEEILASMIDSADAVVYDGDVVPYYDFVGGGPNVAGKTLDELRDDRAWAMGWVNLELEHIDYRFLRVDKAYMDLTEKRTHGIADRIEDAGSTHAGVIDAFAEELGGRLDQDTADIFQRLDAADTARQADVARQMSPAFLNSTAEAAHLGLVGLHRGMGQRTELARLMGKSKDCGPEACDPCEKVAACDPCEEVAACDPCADVCGKKGVKLSGWVEGFGGNADRNGTMNNSGYNSDLAGTSFGIQRTRKNRTFGVFGSYGRQTLDGNDGRAEGDWGTVGMFGRLDRKRGFVEGSVALGFGDVDLNRRVFIPGAIFAGSKPGELVVLDPMRKSTSANTEATGISARLAAGRDSWKINGWKVGPRAEFSLSYLDFDGYEEQGGDSLALGVNAYQTTYLEGGVGLHAGKAFRVNKRSFLASAKLMGMYGGMTGDDLSGKFLGGGSEFTTDADHMSTGWIAPEASLSWQIRKNIYLTGTYAGRFGEDFSDNTGSVALNLFW